MRKYIAVFDETGTNNRPQAVAESSFGVGGVIFPSELGASLVEVSKKIGNAVKNGDFKWKDVHNNETARTLFLTGLNGMNPQVHLFAFYTHGACMLHESKRTNDAALVYGIDHTTKISSEGEAFDHLKSFIKYAASCLAAHAWTNQYTLEIYWDRRTDLNHIKESFDQHIEILSKTKRYNGVADLVSFVGQVPTKI
ncbi:MAG: hypothetical protein E6K65_06705 [Nitrospirae bacterium]|nr:MAG: hypothetical protein E6K65_06705 [Nitrospirota bacterium]